MLGAAAATDWVDLPDQWIEVAISLSIMASTTLNLLSKGHAWRWQFAIGFGLIHGLGFASGLRELGLMPQRFLESLRAFNLGVELGPARRTRCCGSPAVALAAARMGARPPAPLGFGLVLPLSGSWLAQRLLA